MKAANARCASDCTPAVLSTVKPRSRANAAAAASSRDLPIPGARHGRGHITLHLPEGWHRQAEWMNLFEAACGPPPAAAA